MSRLLARASWRVHVLFCGWGDDRTLLERMPSQLARDGICFTALEKLPRPDWLAARYQFGNDGFWTVMSQRVLEALPGLHEKHHFDLIEFPDWGGLGFRSIQAKRSGVSMTEVRLSVALHGPSRWQREGNLAWPLQPTDLKTDFAERYAYENADFQRSESRYMLNYARAAGWAVRDDATLGYPFPEPEIRVSRASALREIVFFGRLELRKGLDLFLDAVDRLPSDIPLLFLGRDTVIGNRKATSIIGERCAGRDYRIETELDRTSALSRLATGDRVVVMPSRMENTAFSVAECIANQVPFIASDVGGIPELLLHEEARSRWLCEPTVEGIAQAVTDRLDASYDDDLALRAQVAANPPQRAWNARIAESYGELLKSPARESASVKVSADRSATVAVAVTHFNQGAWLPSALESIAHQTRPPDEVIVIDDGSDSAEALRAFSEEQSRYPHWRFVRQDNAGPGAARNACLGLAKSEYFLPFDADNRARPQLVGTLMKAAQCRPGLAAAACHYVAFVDQMDLQRSRFEYCFAPLGGPRISSCMENIYGDTCSLFHAESLRSLGGFETERWSPFEDHETFVKMVSRDLEVDVVPVVLFDYRAGREGRLERLKAFPDTAFRHQRRLIDEFLVNASLTRLERTELWECVLGFATTTVWQQNSRPRSVADRINDLQNLIRDQRSRGRGPTQVARTVAEAILRR